MGTMESGGKIRKSGWKFGQSRIWLNWLDTVPARVTAEIRYIPNFDKSDSWFISKSSDNCVKCPNLRFERINDATSAHRGTIPLRVLFTTNSTAHAAISLSSTKSLSSSDCAPRMNTMATFRDWYNLHVNTLSISHAITKQISVRSHMLRQ